MRKFIASAVAAAAILIPTSAARAAEPGQKCALTYGDADTIISLGASDCIVDYASEDAAVAAINQARADGLYVWHRDGFVVSDGLGGFVVRASVAPDPTTVPLEVVVSPA